MFVLDVGLLSCMTGLSQRTLLDGNQLFVDNGNRIIPGEVKAAINLHVKSLTVYQEKIQPKLCIRTSMADYRKEDWLINLPLYAIDQIEAL